MRRRVNIKRRGAVEEPEIIVIPMIDVMMFLLFFFMVASLAMVTQNALPVNLPKASTSAESHTESLTVTIQPNGKIFLNITPVTLDNISSKLSALGVTAKNVVTINADERVPHGTVIAVMDEARKAGVQAFGFATNRK